MSTVGDTGRVAGARAQRRSDLAEARAESRVSAYVYGNVLVLAAVVGASPAAVRSGAAVAIVVGTVLSTYVAHVLAHSIGSLLVGEATWTAVREELRDAVPIISSGTTPAVLLGVTAAGWLPAAWGQALASAILLGRVAATGAVYRRLREGVPAGRAWAIGVAAAGVATVVVVLKLTLTH